MTKQLQLGRRGEQLAVEHLSKLNYEILERNYRFSRAEIDIIALNKGVLVFVEVKAKSYDYYGQPEESINQLKRDLMIDTAYQYMEKINHDWEIRFDIVSLMIRDENNVELQHFKDVFF